MGWVLESRPGFFVNCIGSRLALGDFTLQLCMCTCWVLSLQVLGFQPF